MSKPLFSVSIGPDAIHWMHTVTIHDTYKDALRTYDLAPPRWSAAIIRMDDNGYEPGRRVLKRANQYNHGHAAVWCDGANLRLQQTAGMT